jgi:hypothetical protein
MHDPLHMITAIVLVLPHIHVGSREVQYVVYCKMDCFEQWSNNILSVIGKISGGNNVDT